MKRLTGIGIGAAAILAGSAIIGAAVATNPAAAAEARSLLEPFGLTTCNTSNPCTEFMNKGSGPAIRGDGSSGEGVDGVSLSSNGMRGTTAAASKTKHPGSGVVGVDQSTDGGILNAGVSGLSATGTGVQGLTYGTASSTAGVIGESLQTSGSFSPGVTGLSNNSSPGVLGQSVNGGYDAVGVDGEEHGGGVAVLARNGGQSQAGSVALYAQSLGGVGNYGAFIASDGIALYAQNANPSVGPAAVIQGGSSDPTTNSLVTEDNFGSPTFWVDNGGNAHVRGLLFTSGPCSTGCLKTKNSPAKLVQRYTLEESVPAIEDVGEAQLSGGSAYVRVDSAFANVMDRQATYLVFVTPQGPTRGLYVTNKTAQGFEVKEESGGGASIAFDYRIVAKPLGQSAPRLPMIVTPLSPKAPPMPYAHTRH
jgi:hypothetical protein